MKYKNFTWSPFEVASSSAELAKITENCSPTENLPTKKPSKVKDKNKNIKLHPPHEANLWNVGFANSGRTSYWFPWFYNFEGQAEIQVLWFSQVKTNVSTFWRVNYNTNVQVTSWWHHMTKTFAQNFRLNLLVKFYEK